MAYNDFSGFERRRFVRLCFPLKIKFRIISEKNNEDFLKVYNAITRDISTHGLCMKINALHKEACDRIKNGQDELELEITLSSDNLEIIKLSGVAIRLLEEHSKSYHTGVIFTRFEEDEKIKLLHFMKTKMNQ